MQVGLTMMARFNYQGVNIAACESLSSGNGTVVFTPANRRLASRFPVTLQKRIYSNIPTMSQSYDRYLNWTKDEILSSPVDILGNFFLGIHGFPARQHEASWAEVANAMPPIRSIGAWANGAGNPRVWTANRESGRDMVFDGNGYNHLNGAPGPENVQRVLPGLGDKAFVAEGTYVGTPALVLSFPTALNSSTTLWEMSVVPVPNNTGFVQPVFIRFLQVIA